MKVAITAVIGSLLVALPANAYVKIPNPPVSGTPRNHGMTRQTCLNQAASVRRGKLRAGQSRQSADKWWAKEVEKCKRLPDRLPQN